MPIILFVNCLFASEIVPISQLNVYFMDSKSKKVVELSVFDLKQNKSVFKRVVMCVDCFEYDAFVRVMRSIFGEKAIIEFIVV